MTAKIEIVGNIDGQAMAADLNRTISDVFSSILQEETTLMKVRINEGRDVNNTGFRPYSPEYIKFKGKPNSQGKSRQTSPVDLTYSGRMLASITTDVKPLGNKFEGTVFFSSNAEALKARGNIDNGRDFFGFTDEQQTRLKDKLETAIKG